MKKNVRKSLLITSLLATSFLACGAVASVSASATGAEATTPVEFSTAFGASVRVSDPNGLRFRLQLSDEKKTEIFAQDSGKTLGMYIFPSSKLDTVTDYSTLTQKIDLTFSESDLYQVEGYWYANGVMTNLYLQNFTKEFVGVGYVATAGETTTYEYSVVNKEDNARSMAYVASELYKMEEMADYQDCLETFIEKSAYAAYGVSEIRTEESVSFVKGESTWTSYAEMTEALPVSMSVAATQADLFVGETLDLNAALTVNGTAITALNVPFTYDFNSNAITVENGVVKAVGVGEAEITVSFGEYSETVAINASEKANVVFNPASANAAAQITYNGAGFNYGNSVEQRFISAQANTNTTYGEAYVTATVSKTGWGNMFITPLYALSEYAQYDAVTAWIYVESTKGETLNATFLGADLDLSRTIYTNNWMKVTFPIEKFMAKDYSTQNFVSINFTSTMKSICIGEIVGVNYEDTPEVVFDPEMGNTMQITLTSTDSYAIFTNAAKVFVNDAANTDETYGGAYFKVNPNNLVSNAYRYGYIGISSLNTTYSDYTHVKAWMYVETGTATSVNVTIGGILFPVNSNQWVQVSIPVADFLATPNFVMNWRNNGTWGVTGLRIGDIIAVKEVRNDVFLFNPASETAASQVSTNGKAFGDGNKATFNYVASSADATYNGAYVQIGSTAMTTSNQWGNVMITPADAVETYAAYTTIKVWIYVEGYGTADISWSLWGTGAQTFARNQWVQLEISAQAYVANAANVFVGANFATNANWGIYGIRIGEITAV